MKAIITDLLKELSYFPGREEGLREIRRFSVVDRVFYRSSDFSHSKRVAWLVAYSEPIIRQNHSGFFDFKRACATALVHDDAEIITGDYQAGNKSKMTKEQLAALDEEEREAIEELSRRFPKTVGGYEYKELLLDVLDLKRPEAQVAKYLDRFDALGETLHELYAGNRNMHTNTLNEYGILPKPFDFYLARLPKMIEENEALLPLKNKHAFFRVPESAAWEEVIRSGTPHTADSLRRQVSHPQYNEWKKAILSLGDEEEIENLHSQREFI